MKEIQASLHDLGEQATAEASDEDSDSDEEEEEGGRSFILVSFTLCHFYF